MDTVAIKISNVPKPANNAARDPNHSRLGNLEATGGSGFISVICSPSCPASLLSVAIAGKTLRLASGPLSSEGNREMYIAKLARAPPDEMSRCRAQLSG